MQWPQSTFRGQSQLPIASGRGGKTELDMLDRCIVVRRCSSVNNGRLAVPKNKAASFIVDGVWKTVRSGALAVTDQGYSGHLAVSR